MPRWTLIVLLSAGVVCAAVGTVLILQTTPLGAAGFGWTAYSPLSSTTYSPGDPTRLVWTPRIAGALLAIGAGTTGATGVALLLNYEKPKTTPTADAD